jgi:hypothetical protein
MMNRKRTTSPASARQIPGNDMVYVREQLDNRILFVPGAFTISSEGIWWSVDEIKTFKEQGFVGLKLWPHGAILSSKIPLIHEQLDEAGRQGMPLVGYHTGTLGGLTKNLAVEIAGKVYPGVDNLNGTWKLPGSRIAGLPAGTYDVKVTAKNSIGLVRTDATTNELTVEAPR